MSDKFIIFSDLHIHSHGSDWKRVDDAIEVLDWVKEEALKREVKTIFFLGDFFHVRGFMYPSVVAKSYRKLLEFKDAGLEMVLLVGNHDMPYKNSTRDNCLTAFNSIFPVVEQPMVWEGENANFYFLPYVENPSQLSWAIEQVHGRSLGEYSPSPNVKTRRKDKVDKKRVLLAHLDIKNAMYHTNIESTSGITKEALKEKFDLIVSGHYHIPQQVDDNIWYAGSPYQQNFGESNQDKGIIFYNDGELEYIQNTFSPKYLHITERKINKSIEGNYIKVQVGSADNIAAIREKAAQFNPRAISVTLAQEALSPNDRLVELKSSTKDVKAMLQEWVGKNANPSVYDRDRLYSYGVDIVESIKGEE